MVRLLVNKFFDRPLTATRMSAFKEYTKRALSVSINESISSRLKSALSINENIESEKQEQSVDEKQEPKHITTEEETEAFYIVKAILREKISLDRIAARDTQSYFGVLLDDNNRKPICRLHFNTSNKYLEIFHNGKDAGEKFLLNNLEEIYTYRNELLKTLENYE